VFALLLADREIEVIGVDPARASIDVARAKPGSERVRWICGDATDLPPLQVDLATMTANVAQAIGDPQTWHTRRYEEHTKHCGLADIWSSRRAIRPDAPGKSGPARTPTT
jgi:Methyltransferase domain